MLTPLRNSIGPPPNSKSWKIHGEKVSFETESQLKSLILRKWPLITLRISLATHHKMSIQRTENSILLNTVTTSTLHLRKKTADTIDTGF